MTMRLLSVFASKWLVASAVLYVACAACESTPNNERDEGERRSSTGGSESFGPLAVIDFGNHGGSLASGGTGSLDISTDCVQVVLPNGTAVLPVWQLGDVEWNEATETIRFISGQEAIDLRNGDRVRLSGEALEGDEAVSRPELPWVNPPSESCSGDRFLVDGLTSARRIG